MTAGETILGDEQAIITVAPGKRKGGFVVQTDRAIYICVQGALGTGRVKQVHRLAVSDVLDQRGGQDGVSRGSMEVMFVAEKKNLTIGTTPPLDISQELGDVKMVVVSFRNFSEGSRWGGWWDQAVQAYRSEQGL